MNVSFTGSCRGMTAPQQSALHWILQELGCTTFHHGCAQGADIEAHNIVKILGRIVVEIYPGLNDKGVYVGALPLRSTDDMWHSSGPFLARNRRIVKASPYLIATPRGFMEEKRSGTWATVRYAESQGKKVTIIYPNGAVDEY